MKNNLIYKIKRSIGDTFNFPIRIKQGDLEDYNDIFQLEKFYPRKIRGSLEFNYQRMSGSLEEISRLVYDEFCSNGWFFSGPSDYDWLEVNHKIITLGTFIEKHNFRIKTVTWPDMHTLDIIKSPYLAKITFSVKIPDNLIRQPLFKWNKS